jgi:gas vesicle protein
MNNSQSFVFGVIVGAGTAYLLDPDRGRRRRALLRDQLVHAGHEAGDAARGGLRHARNRAGGLAHEAKAQLLDRDADDSVLRERVRSEIGRVVSNAGAVEVLAEAGRVTLSGRVPSSEVQELVRVVRSVRGVQHVDNHLDVEARPDSAPELQGTRRST